MGRGRRRLVRALVVLGSLLAFLSVLAIWTERQALNTDDWVETSDRLIQNATIREAVADYLVDTLYENVDVEKEVEDILPGDTKSLAGPLSGGLRQVAGDGANKVLETNTARSLWRGANRAAHEELVAVLEDKQRAGISTSEGEVTLNLAKMVTNLANEVGIGASLAEKLPEDAGRIVILRSDELKTAQDIVIAVKGLALVFSLLTFLVFGLAIYLARESRWVTILSCGIGLVAAGFLVIVVRKIAGGIVVDQLVEEESVRPAAEAAWSISTSLMVSIAITYIVIGILFGVAGWLASPTDPARATRRAAAPALRDYTAYVYAALAILVGIYFVTAPTHNLRSFLTTLAVAALAAFGIDALRRQTAEEYPDVTFGDVFGGARGRVDRVAGAVKGANLTERASKLRLPEVRRPGAGEGTGAGEGAGAPQTADAGGGSVEAAEAPTATLPSEPSAGVAPPAGAGPAAPAPAAAGGVAPATTADVAPATPTPADDLDTKLARLERLGNLREKGVLTDEEFKAEKRRVMGDE